MRGWQLAVRNQLFSANALATHFATARAPALFLGVFAMKVSGCFPSKYLKASDIPDGREVPVQIDAIQVEPMEQSGDDKPVLYFIGKKKGLVLNKTNAAVLSAAFGDESDQWHGKSVLLFSAMTQYGGRMVPCLRIKLARPPAIAAPPVEAANAELQQAAAAMDPADIPF
jgi:hypothetical protein